MSDLVREYDDFVGELRAEYASRGYRIISTDEIAPRLGFRPDLVVAQNGETTVIEVKSAGRMPAARINELRKRAEQLGYRFELKVVPRRPKRGWDRSILPGFRDYWRTPKNSWTPIVQILALLLSWIAFERSVRAVAARKTNVQAQLTATGELVKMAIELELISEDELADLRAIDELRNRVVHGFETEIPRRLVARAIAFARQIAGAARLADA